MDLNTKPELESNIVNKFKKKEKEKK